MDLFLYWYAQFRYFVVYLAYLYYTQNIFFLYSGGNFFYKFFYTILPRKNCFMIFLYKSFFVIINFLVGRNWIPRYFLGHYLVSPTLHPGFSDPWRSSPALSSTPTQGYFFFECLGIQFFNSHSHVTYGTDVRGHSHSFFNSELLGVLKCYIYLTMKYNASYEIWTVFTIVYWNRSSILYPFGHRTLWSMED